MTASQTAQGVSRTIARVLVVEADDDVREVLGLSFNGMGLAADCVSGFAAARALLTQRAYRLCLTDLTLADGDGLSLVRHIREYCPGLAVVVLTSSASMESAVTALKAGATDCLAKPLSLDELRALVRNTLDIVLPAAPLPIALPLGALLGEAPAMVELRETITRLARLRVTVVIVGESGSGKSLAARLIHAASARTDRPFVVVDCAAGPDALELFGAEKGASLEGGGVIDGLMQAADGGTVFLHRVDELPRPQQVRLARVLKSGRLRRVGAVFDEAVDVRIIAASTAPLKRSFDEGRLDPALYYTLDFVELQMPALRERTQDIPLLCAHMLARLGEDLGLPAATCAEDALARLVQHDFPGNVRELECVLERSLALAGVEELHAGDLRLPEVPDSAALHH